MVRRAPFVIGATGVGLGLLLSFHTEPIHLSSVSTGSGANGSGPSTDGQPSGSGVSSPATAGTAPASTATVPSSTGTAPGQTGPAPTTAPPTTTAAVRNATSQDVQYRYGDIQLKVTERGSSITNIKVVQEGATDPRSAQINSQAVPMLQQQAMSAQSANIDGVSGATFTSMAYQEALQSALDQLK